MMEAIKTKAFQGLRAVETKWNVSKERSRLAAALVGCVTQCGSTCVRLSLQCLRC